MGRSGGRFPGGVVDHRASITAATAEGSDPAEIRAIASAVRLPLNVLARPGLPAASELEALGVRRLSAGSGIASAAFGSIASLAAEFLQRGSSDPLAAGAMPYAEINALMVDR